MAMEQAGYFFSATGKKRDPRKRNYQPYADTGDEVRAKLGVRKL